MRRLGILAVLAVMTSVLGLTGCASSANRGGVVDCDPERAGVLRSAQCQLAWERRQAGREAHFERLAAQRDAERRRESGLIDRRNAEFRRIESAENELSRLQADFAWMSRLNERSVNNEAALRRIAQTIEAADRAVASLERSYAELEQTGLCPPGEERQRTRVLRSTLNEARSVVGGSLLAAGVVQGLRQLPSRGVAGIVRAIGVPMVRGIDGLMTARSGARATRDVMVATRDGWSSCAPRNR